MDQPLDPDLNNAIRTIASRVLPRGFCASDRAPSTLEELTAHVEANNHFAVWNGASGRSIYGDPATNYAFRAWHDWCHYIGGLPFDMTGEERVCSMQVRQLFIEHGNTPLTRYWQKIIEAEVIGQNKFAHIHKRFPDDQMGFVQAYLHDPQSALSWSLW